MRTRLAVTFLLAVVALNLAAAPRQGGDEIPLRNWAVSFERTAPAAPSSTGGFHAVADSVSAGNVFVPVTPCRIVDTRSLNPPIFAAGDVRSYSLPSLGMSTGCFVPAAAAYSLNFTIANYTGRGNIKAYPTGTTPPSVSILNYGDGLPLANAAIVPADVNGSIDVAAAITATPGPTNVIIDINGYFTAAPAPPAGLLTYTTVGGPFLLPVPAAVTRILVEAWGGGGGGAISSMPIFLFGAGGSGGYARGIIAVTPNSTLALTVGSGGAGATDPATPNGSPGGDTRIEVVSGMAPLLTAGGGPGGNSMTQIFGGTVTAGATATLFQMVSGSSSSGLFFVPGAGGTAGSLMPAVPGGAGKPGALTITFLP